MNYHEIVKVLNQLDIPVVEELNGWVRTPCPFAAFRHEKGTDNNPGFGVSIHAGDTSFYNCLACKSNGPFSQLPMQLAPYRDDPSLIELSQSIMRDEILGGSVDFGQWEDRTAVKKTSTHHVTKFPGEKDFLQKFPSALSSPEACRYLARRRLSASTIVSLGLRYDERQQRILFPVYDQRTGRYAGCTGRSIHSARWLQRDEERGRRINAKYTNPKIRDYGGLQKDRLLLGSLGYHPPDTSSKLHVHKQRVSVKQHVTVSYRILAVEGLFGYGTFRQLRPRYTTVALLGSKLTEGKRQLFLEANKPVYWFTDPDRAGLSCLYGKWNPETEDFDHKTGALYQLYGQIPQFVVSWPEGKIDPDELSGEEIDHMIDTAELWVK